MFLNYLPLNYTQHGLGERVHMILKGQPQTITQSQLVLQPKTQSKQKPGTGLDLKGSSFHLHIKMYDNSVS